MKTRKFAEGGWIKSMQDKAKRNRAGVLAGREAAAMGETPASKPAPAPKKPAMSQSEFSGYDKPAKKMKKGGMVRDKYKRARGR